MSADELTLNAVLGLSRQDGTRQRLSPMLMDDALSGLREQLGGGGVARLGEVLEDRVEEAVRSALDIPLTGVLAGGWNRYRELLQYRDPVRHPPDEVNMVPLQRHTVTSTHRPYVELRLGEHPVGTIQLEVQVEITLEGAVLTIQGGRFKELRPGKTQVEASLSCKGAQLVKRRLGEYTLPGVISFGDGIPIAPSLPPPPPLEEPLMPPPA